MKNDWLDEDMNEEFIEECQQRINEIAEKYKIHEYHAGCYLCNFEDQYICREYNGDCEAYEICKEINRKEELD